MQAPSCAVAGAMAVVVILLLTAGDAKPVQRGGRGSVMAILFGQKQLHSKTTENQDTVTIGQARVRVGGAPDYVEGRDVFTRDFWLGSISQVLRRLYTVLERHEASEEVLSAQARLEETKDMELEAKENSMIGENPDQVKEETVDEVEKALEQVDDVAGHVGAKLGQTDAELGNIDDEISHIDLELGQVEAKVGQVEVNVNNVEEKVGEVMQVIQMKDWSDEDLETLFWILHELIQSGSVVVGDGKVTINGEDFYLKDLITMCCPIG